MRLNTWQRIKKTNSRILFNSSHFFSFSAKQNQYFSSILQRIPATLLKVDELSSNVPFKKLV